MIQAVIFDMDGTLIDTEKYYRIFWPKAVEAYGYTMTDEQAGLLPPDSLRTGTARNLIIMPCGINEKN